MEESLYISLLSSDLEAASFPIDCVWKLQLRSVSPQPN